MTMRPKTAWLMALLALLAVSASEAVAHGTATLKSSSSSVEAGGTLTLGGAGFEPGESYRLLFRGALDEREIRTVTARVDSTFTVELQVSADTRPGQYRLVAVAPDGDEVASLDLAVIAASETHDVAPGHAEDMGTAVSHGAAGARTDEIVIERRRAGVEWGVIGLLIGLAGGLGIGLLRRPGEALP